MSELIRALIEVKVREDYIHSFIEEHERGVEPEEEEYPPSTIHKTIFIMQPPKWWLFLFLPTKK